MSLRPNSIFRVAGTVPGYKKNEKIIAISLTCSTARSGRAFLTFDVDDEASGFGSFRLSDGSGGQLEFGAKRLLAAGTLAGTPTE